MKIQIDHLSFNILADENKLDINLLPVIFLHGFTGSAKDWSFIFDQLPEKYFPIAIDLIGHGKTDHPEDIYDYTTEAQIYQLKQIIAYFKFEKIILCGYSMGGRLALSYAARHPAVVSRLILESSSPGLQIQEERKERIKQDFKLADKIESEGMEKFIDYWMNIPLFSTLKNLPVGKLQDIKTAKLNNHPEGLVNSLKGFSTGLMPSLWYEMLNFNNDTLLITGEKDVKFTTINKDVVTKLQHAEHKILSDCGHNVHLEKPEEFIILVNQFLNK